MKTHLLGALSLALSFGLPALRAADSAPASAETIAALRAELEAMHETDQSQRSRITEVTNRLGPGSAEVQALWKVQKEIDDRNIRRLEEIIAEHGWPKISAVGARAASAAFLILQHSDITYQKKYLPLTRAAVAAQEMRGSSLALLEDRILMREGKKQIYGSQLRSNSAGQLEVHPIEDEANVDQRRAAVGLPPLAEYLRGFAERGSRLADPRNEQPAAEAPPLTQALFAEADDARAAFRKIMQVRSPRGADLVEFQRACRDFCTRFPQSGNYGQVRLIAAGRWFSLSDTEREQLPGWDATTAENDPKLTLDQRASVALQLAPRRAPRPPSGDNVSSADHVFDAVLGAIGPYRETQAARDTLVRVALVVTPAKAIPRLREAYPADPSVAAAIAALEKIGQPCDFRITATDGRTIDAATHRGKVVLLHFWSSQSTALLSTLKTLTASPRATDLVVLGVNLDPDRAAADAALQAHAATWPNQHDGLGWNTPLGRSLLVKSIPSYFLIDRSGRLRYRGHGELTVVTRQLEELLTEK